MTKYPRINNISMLKKVPYCKCGEVATHATIVQVNQFRGDDDVYYTCDSHKRDLSFLREGLEEHKEHD